MHRVLWLVALEDLRQTLGDSQALTSRSTQQVGQSQRVQALLVREVECEELARQPTFFCFGPSTRVMSNESHNIAVHAVEIQVGRPVDRVHPCPHEGLRVADIMEPGSLHDTLAYKAGLCPLLSQSRNTHHMPPAPEHPVEQLTRELSTLRHGPRHVEERTPRLH